MRANVVWAYPEPRSCKAHLAATARQPLVRHGWSVTVSDHCRTGFDPCERSMRHADVLRPFVADEGEAAALRHSDPAAVEAGLKRTAEGLAATLARLKDVPSGPFGAMAECGDEGRTAPRAAVLSPFTRRKRRLASG